jgi:hypothetical protein
MDRARVAEDPSSEELVCDLSAIPPNDRLRYHDLRAQLRAAYISSKSINKGYALRLNEERMSMENVSEWITLEDLCCPWLSLKAERIKPPTLEVRMKVPDRARQVLRMELDDLLG